MSITLTPEQEAIVKSRVNAGMYESAATMIDKALTILEETEDRRARERVFFEREVRPALDALDRGEGKPLDMDEIIAEANRRLDERGVGY
ncbi:MAG: type II toxin-antitoxin system ParD family antitoxin [Planctomycetales bacterium]|nr:type II toxin-antitoxin system ParD family antitoxin [Planctomycetales bacterium]